MPRRLALLSVCVCVAAGVGVRSASALSRTFVAQLGGPNEAPPNASPATGFATVTLDTVAHTMNVGINFQGLLANNTAAHIHATTALPFTGTAGVATTTPTFTGFPTGVTAGSYAHLFDMTQASSYNPAFVTANGGTLAAAEAALLTAMTNGKGYVNIHSQTFPGGEIRGFLVPAFTDDPLTAGVTLVKAGHIAELRQHIDLRRVRLGLALYSWTDPTIDAGAVIKAQHVLDLRLALAQAYVQAGQTPPTYADPGLAAGTTIGAVHVAQVRTAVVALP